MLRNKLLFGTIFGLIFSAPIVFSLSFVLNSWYDLHFTVATGILLLLAIYLGILIFAVTVAVGLFRNKLWALRTFTFLLIIAAAITSISVLADSFEYDYEFIIFGIGRVLAIATFTVGAVAILNNDVVLQQFGVEEADEILDDILDA